MCTVALAGVVVSGIGTAASIAQANYQARVANRRAEITLSLIHI